MRSSLALHALLALFGAAPAFANYETFYFAGNGGNSSVLSKCKNSVFGCIPPSVCAHEGVSGVDYCCNVGASNAVCWTQATQCAGDVNHTTPSAAQQICGAGQAAFCCGKTTQRCTETYNQINICWSQIDDPLGALDPVRLNDTYSSLSSAAPTGTVFPVSSAALLALVTQTPGVSSSTGSAAAQSTASSAPSSSTTGPPSSGLSGGAIGGIVGGILGGLALIGLVAFLLWRRRRAAQTQPGPHELPPQNAYNQNQYGYQQPPMGAADPSQSPYRESVKFAHNGYAQGTPHEMNGSNVAELYTPEHHHEPQYQAK